MDVVQSDVKPLSAERVLSSNSSTATPSTYYQALKISDLEFSSLVESLYQKRMFDISSMDRFHVGSVGVSFELINYLPLDCM